MEQQQEKAVPQCTFTAPPEQDLDRPPIISPLLPTTGDRSNTSMSHQPNNVANNAWRDGGLSSNVADERHRSDVVVVPDRWSQEEMLKDWLDFGSFDALLAPKGLMLARAALVADQTRQASKEAVEINNKAYLGMHLSAARCT